MGVTVDAGRRVLAGTASGFLATFVLSGLRESLEKLGWVHTTAPQQVISRLEEASLLYSWPPRSRQVKESA